VKTNTPQSRQSRKQAWRISSCYPLENEPGIYRHNFFLRVR
jgi:hypothetical protein